tara:strand:- start:7777 stop:8463 length:687 start_codon:yes stop_codon:yes gene_type:complete
LLPIKETVMRRLCHIVAAGLMALSLSACGPAGPTSSEQREAIILAAMKIEKERGIELYNKDVEWDEGILGDPSCLNERMLIYTAERLILDAYYNKRGFILANPKGICNYQGELETIYPLPDKVQEKPENEFEKWGLPEKDAYSNLTRQYPAKRSDTVYYCNEGDKRVGNMCHRNMSAECKVEAIKQDPQPDTVKKGLAYPSTVTFRRTCGDVVIESESIVYMMGTGSE